MDRIYKYAVLIATPSQRRGERVNIGVVVFREDKADIRLMHANHKLKLLTRQSWEDRLEAATARLGSLFDEERSPDGALERFALFEPIISTSGFGTLTARDDADYERTVGQIIESLVGIPAREKSGKKSSKLNTEIAADLKKANVLASDDEGIDNKKVVRDYEIDESEGLRADFALKNGVIHIISTLDLRIHRANLETAALKSIILDKALKKFGEGRVKRFGAYAVAPDMREGFSQHLRMFGEYARNGLWDWSQPDDRNKLRKSIFDALEHDDPLI
jgi:hypothetical protein